MYGPRALGLALGFFCVAAVLREHGAPPLLWVALALNGFAWPHVAWLIARHSAEPRRAELRNLVADSALGGAWIVAMGCNPLPSVLLASMLSMDKVAAGGGKLLARGALAMLAAGAVTALLFGVEIRLETTPLIVAGCVPLLVVYPLAVGVATHRLARSLRERRRELEVQIAEHLRTQEALARAKQHAEEANHAKSEFLSRVSHELRTPLNSILGFAELLTLDARTPLTPEQLESVTLIGDSGRHLLALINDLLDVARIEAGKFVPKLENVDAGELVAECVALVAVAAERRGIAVHHECRAARPVRTDRVRLRQILLNFLSNAVKYNRDGGVIRVTAENAGDASVRIAVSDTGRGIPEDRRAELFEPFSRLGAESSATEGAGVGLVVAKRLAEATGGRMGFSSEAGRGSTFWVDMPAADAAAA